MFRRDRHRLTETERISFQPSRFTCRAFAFVGDKHDWLAGLARDIRESVVSGYRPGAGVDHKEYRIGLADRSFGLRLHAARKTFGHRLLEARGINHRKLDVAEPPLALATIACDAR